jgi:hypothetical protein
MAVGCEVFDMACPIPDVRERRDHGSTADFRRAAHQWRRERRARRPWSATLRHSTPRSGCPSGPIDQMVLHPGPSDRACISQAVRRWISDCAVTRGCLITHVRVPQSVEAERAWLN